MLSLAITCESFRLGRLRPTVARATRSSTTKVDDEPKVGKCWECTCKNLEIWMENDGNGCWYRYWIPNNLATTAGYGNG